MIKTEFLADLRARISALPQSEIEKSAGYYNEMIDDRMEDGMTEEEAVAALGSMDEIVQNILYDQTIPALMKARVNQSKNKSDNKMIWLILVLLGFPVWFPLLMAFASVIFALYITVWSLILAIYAVLIAFIISGAASIVGGIIYCAVVNFPLGLCAIGIGLGFIGVSLFMVKPIFILTKGLAKVTGHVIRKIKSLFIRKMGD